LSQPLVSVVTPFRNTAQYLGQCIESVLAQTYTQFEYILSDNCSTDGSMEIAERYARSDPRIRLIRQPALLSQVPHYNSVLAQISSESRYCKVVQADDWIFPDCLRLMVRAFQQSDSIGLVSSYDLKGDVVRGSGFPDQLSMLLGKEMARIHLRTGLFVFGSPTTVMYRSSLVREPQPFFEEHRLHEDTEKCMQILEHWNFGFVHQVLSFLRIDGESISAAVRTFQPHAIDRYIIVQRFASTFLGAHEAAALRNSSKRDYYRILAHEALRFRERPFWAYHKSGLATINARLDWLYLALQICCKLLWMIANPGATIRTAFRLCAQNFAALRGTGETGTHQRDA